MIPKPQRDDKGKVQGEFYPLQKAELVALRKAKLINNAAFVHLALRYENPYCDRPIVVVPKEFACRWQIPESSVYEAIAKLKESEAINIRSGRITIEWADSQQKSVDDSQQIPNSGNPESFWESRNGSENPETVLRTQKKLRKSRKNSGSPENRSSKPSRRKVSSDSQTYSDYSNFIQTLSQGERESFEKFVREEWKRLTAKNGLPGEEIVSLERFLAREEDIKNWYQRFLNSSTGREAKKQAIAAQYNWENDPRLLDWLNKAYYEGYLWTQEDEAEREQRTAFFLWAQETNAYAGRIADELA